ncbi:MAG: transposase, partial [Desulfobacca sp.]|nr:transposase [Desulfobacca sp.]
AGLNKAILDQGWYEFRRQLAYKLAWAGGMLELVPPHHTSQICPECDHVSKNNRRSQAVFRCEECGFEDHADPCCVNKHIKKGGARPDSLFGAARPRIPRSAGIKGPLGPVGRNHPGWRDARNLRPLGRRGCQKFGNFRWF